jgi:hypothetical protein
MKIKMTVSKDCIKKSRDKLLGNGRNPYVDCIANGELEFDEFADGNEIFVGGWIIKIESNKEEIKKLIEYFLKKL